MSQSHLPLFIVLEGLDGVGKSTLAERLAAQLGAMEMRTPPPALNPLRSQILRCFEDSPMATTLYYAACVADASRKVARRQAAGRAVVLDRYFLSTYVYGAIVRASDHPTAVLDALVPRLMPPDVTIYLHADRAQRRQRMQARKHIGYEDQLTIDPDTAARLDAGFRRCGDHPLAGRFFPIDSTNLSADETVQVALQFLVAAGLWSPVVADQRGPAYLAGGAP